ncbi:hypothetical protein K7T73_07135 [Bacillus badius]|uniref:hypothetical protein n=1 Tax=Bacillus badius TaxID=1455 RepID=UPI001CBB87D6|nr:hypothetical protein [Bacillus badius]UAT31986.1 hypothetical protein K7T73_07135 [Bacillus badius]
MGSKKEDIKKEILSNVRNIIILILAIILIYFDISIAKSLGFTEDKRIVWALDFGIYNSLISVTFSVVNYFIRQKKLYINVELLNKEEDVNEITLKETPKEIYVKIQIEGTRKNIPSNMQLIFPHWVDFQTKPQPYLTINDTENKCLIDINYFISNKDNISLTTSITFDVISNDDEKNEELMESKLKLGFLAKCFRIQLQNKGIKIRNK